MDLKGIAINSLMIGLFIFSFFTFMIFFSEQNSTGTKITDNPAINRAFVNITQELENSTAQADLQRRALVTESSSSPTITALGFIFTSVLNAGKIYMEVVVNMFTYLILMVEETLGINPIVTGTLMTILLVVLVLNAWRVYRAGE